MSTMRDEAKPYLEQEDRTKSLQVQLPPGLFRALKASAKLNGLSLNGEIIFQLLKAYDKPQEQSNISKLMTLR